MFDQLFNDVFTGTTINPASMFGAIGIALVLGLILAKVYQYKTIYSKSFMMSLVMLPTLIAIVIFLVNGSLGAGVAVMGAFSLIRFRSAPGGAKELLAIFLAMTIGIAVGMGYLIFASVFIYNHYVSGYVVAGNGEFWADEAFYAPSDCCHSRKFGL